MRKQLFFLFTLFTISVLAACSPQASTQNEMMATKPAETMMEEQVPDTGMEATMEITSTPEMMQEETMGAGAMVDKTSTPEMMDNTATSEMKESTQEPMMGTETPETGMMEETEGMAPAWFHSPFTDEVTGEPFQIADFEGKVVLVETFAQWCPTCLRQQMEIAKLQAMMGMPEDLVTVSLDVDPNEDAVMLEKYLEKHGFNWRFAIAPAETAREIGNLYGQQFLNPPSAPVFVIDRQGKVHPLPFGVKSVEDLEAALKPFLEEGM